MTLPSSDRADLPGRASSSSADTSAAPTAKVRGQQGDDMAQARRR